MLTRQRRFSLQACRPSRLKGSSHIGSTNFPLVRRLSAKSVDGDDDALDAHLVGKSQERIKYSRLPRLYVGSLPSQPIRLSQIINQLLKTRQLHHNRDETKDAASFKQPQATCGVCHPNAIVSLSQDQSHYLTTVLRLGKKGSDSRHFVRVFDGSGSEWLAQVVVMADLAEHGISARRKLRSSSVSVSNGITVQCLQQLRSASSQQQSILSLPQQPQRPFIWLGVAPPKKKDRFRWLIEKAVELQVDAFTFLDTEFSQAAEKGSGYTFAKLQAHFVEASEQSERLNLPCIISLEDDEGGKQKKSTGGRIDRNDAILWTGEQSTSSNNNVEQIAFMDFLQVWAQAYHETQRIQLLFCRERNNKLPILNALQSLTAKDDRSSVQPAAIVILIGPEGGWSESEEGLMDELEGKFPSRIRNISLGPSILRTETAAITALAACNLHFDNYHP